MKNSRLDFVAWNTARVGKKGLLKIRYPVPEVFADAVLELIKA
jgi:hypothetical protein